MNNIVWTWLSLWTVTLIVGAILDRRAQKQKRI